MQGQQQQRPNYRRVRSLNNVYDIRDEEVRCYGRSGKERDEKQGHDDLEEKYPYRHKVTVSPKGFRRRYGRVGSARSLYIVPPPSASSCSSKSNATSDTRSSEEESISPLDVLKSSAAKDNNNNNNKGPKKEEKVKTIKTSRSWTSKRYNTTKPTTSNNFMRGTRKMYKKGSKMSLSARSFSRKDSTTSTSKFNSSISSSVSLLGMDSATALIPQDFSLTSMGGFSSNSSSTFQPGQFLAPGNAELRWNASCTTTSSQNRRNSVNNRGGEMKVSPSLHHTLTPPSRRILSASSDDSLDIHDLEPPQLNDENDRTTTTKQKEEELILATSPKSGREILADDNDNEPTEDNGISPPSPLKYGMLSLSVSELKLLLQEHGIIYSDCLEKSELVERLKQHNNNNNNNKKQQQDKKKLLQDEISSDTEPETEDPTESSHAMEQPFVSTGTGNDTYTANSNNVPLHQQLKWQQYNNKNYHSDRHHHTESDSGQDTCETTKSRMQTVAERSTTNSENEEESMMMAHIPPGEETIESSKSTPRSIGGKDKVFLGDADVVDSHQQQQYQVSIGAKDSQGDDDDDNPYGYDTSAVMIGDDEFNFTQSSSSIGTACRSDGGKTRNKRRGSTGTVAQRYQEIKNKNANATESPSSEPKRKFKRRGSTGALVDVWESKTCKKEEPPVLEGSSRRGARTVLVDLWEEKTQDPKDDEAAAKELNSSRRGSRSVLVDLWEEKIQDPKDEEDPKELNSSRRGPRTALATKWSQELLPLVIKSTTSPRNNEMKKKHKKTAGEEESPKQEAMAKKREQRLKAREKAASFKKEPSLKKQISFNERPSFKKELSIKEPSSKLSIEEKRESSIAKKTLQESEKEIARLARKQKIDDELGRIVRRAEDMKLDEEIDCEVIRALRRAAMDLTYTKMFYDVMKDEFIQFPTIAQTMVDYSLFEMAEKVYREKNDLLPIQYIAALRSIAEYEMVQHSSDVDLEYMDNIAMDLEVSSHHCSAFVEANYNEDEDEAQGTSQAPSEPVDIDRTVEASKSAPTLEENKKKKAALLRERTRKKKKEQKTKSLKNAKENKRAQYKRSASTGSLDPDKIPELESLLPPKKEVSKILTPKKESLRIESQLDDEPTAQENRSKSKSKPRGRSKSADRKKKEKKARSRSRSRGGADAEAKKRSREKRRSNSIGAITEKKKSKQRERGRSRSVEPAEVGLGERKRSSSKSPSSKLRGKKSQSQLKQRGRARSRSVEPPELGLGGEEKRTSSKSPAKFKGKKRSSSVGAIPKKKSAAAADKTKACTPPPPAGSVTSPKVNKPKKSTLPNNKGRTTTSSAQDPKSPRTPKKLSPKTSSPTKSKRKKQQAKSSTTPKPKSKSIQLMMIPDVNNFEASVQFLLGESVIGETQHST